MLKLPLVDLYQLEKMSSEDIKKLEELYTTGNIGREFYEEVFCIWNALVSGDVTPLDYFENIATSSN